MSSPANPQIPSPYVALGAGITALAAARPQALQYINVGNYGNLFRGWREQEVIVLARLLDEARSARLPLSEGRALLALAASEYDTVLTQGPLNAFGEVLAVVPTGQVGVYRKGHRFSVAANPDANPPVQGGIYTVTSDTSVINFTGTDQQFIIPVQASTPGLGGNTPTINEVANAIPIPTSVDAAPVVGASYKLEAAGGMSVLLDDTVRKASFYHATGQFGPTLASIFDGALQGEGVAHMIAWDDPTTAITHVVCADQSWSSSVLWMRKISQIIEDSDTFSGFGCRFDTPAVSSPFFMNQMVRVDMTVMLGDSTFLNDTTQIDDAIKAALNDYFNNRDDWWTFRKSGIRARAVGASRKIRSVTSINVTSAVTGSTLAEPSASLPDTLIPNVFHYYLTPNNVNVTYIPPV